MAHCRSKSGDVVGAVADAEKGINHEYSSADGSAKAKKDSPSPAPTQLLEQFVASTSKVEHEHLSKSLLGWAKGNINLVEQVMRTYQRLAPGAVQHQMVVVDRLLSLCGNGSHPVKHARALVEKAKLVRIVSSPGSSVS